MACYHPIPGWRSRTIGPNRQFGVTFRIDDAWRDKPVQIPCGKCIGCRLTRAQQWGVRVKNELTKEGKLSGFITLTYSDENLPKDNSLDLDHLQRFWKRLRKEIHPERIRYFACGEYGEKTNRPHYHAIVFGYWPQHRVQLPGGDRRIPLYRSSDLERLWPYGHSSIAPATQENATYIAKYTLGKYDESGTIRDFTGRTPPFLTMSRRPGIGHNYARENARALARFDGVRLRGGKLAALPAYYEKVLDRFEPQLARGLRGRRAQRAAELVLPQLHEAPTKTDQEANTRSRDAMFTRAAV